MIDPVNESPANEIARRAAERLAGVDSDLASATERLLQGAPRRRSLDAGTSTALASLLLSLAQFGWTVYQDHLRKKERPEVREILLRRLRVRIEESDADGLLPQGQLERVVEVVAEEILG